MKTSSRRYQTLLRRHTIAKLLCQGLDQTAIGEKVGVSQSCVSRDLTWIRSQWKREMETKFNENLVKELAKIDNLERMCWEAWEKSAKDYKQKTTKAKGKIPGKDKGTNVPKPDYLEKTDKEVTAFGDPRFLQGVQWCIERRCKLLGLDAPEKKELTGKDGKDLFAGMSESELDRKIKEALIVIDGKIV